jgi:hypothetical protein
MMHAQRLRLLQRYTLGSSQAVDSILASKLNSSSEQFLACMHIHVVILVLIFRWVTSLRFLEMSGLPVPPISLSPGLSSAQKLIL